MLNAIGSTDTSFIYSTEAFNDLPEFEKVMLMEQGFDSLELPFLRRKGAENNEYYIYASETEFKTVPAETATLALVDSKTENPLKVVHAHCRIADIVASEILEFVEKPEPVLPAENTPETPPTAAETMAPADAAAPAPEAAAAAPEAETPAAPEAAPAAETPVAAETPAPAAETPPENPEPKAEAPASDSAAQ